jgi:hypothetical protein
MKDVTNIKQPVNEAAIDAVKLERAECYLHTRQLTAAHIAAFRVLDESEETGTLIYPDEIEHLLIGLFHLCDVMELDVTDMIDSALRQRALNNGYSEYNFDQGEQCTCGMFPGLTTGDDVA